MSEAPRDPLAEGLVYHTVVLQGRMVHMGRHHLLMADFVSGSVMSFSWDEVLVALLRLQAEQHEARKAPPVVVAPKPGRRLARFLDRLVGPKDRPT